MSTKSLWLNKYEHITAIDNEMTDGRQTIAIFDNQDELIFVEDFMEAMI
jgi:hypothetical protein